MNDDRRKPRRDKKPVYDVAPTAGEGSEGLVPVTSDAWPRQPAPPLQMPAKPPVFRPLKIYAFGPSLGRARGNIRTIDVRYEKVAPGPVGERVAVIDYDSSRDCFYDPVNLDDPLIAINSGVEPSESDPHFHQQMVYAVASETLRRVEIALGRTIRRRSRDGAAPLRLNIYPHGQVTENAYNYDENIVFGYFRASANATGRTLPGQTIFTCLSHDVIAHVTATTLLTAMRPDLQSDQNALVVILALADLTALLFHFAHSDMVLDTIRRTGGVIYRSQLDTDSVTAGTSPRIMAELATDNPLLALSQDFGDALGRVGGLRSALAAPDPKAFEQTDEPHARAAIMVAAVCDALFSVYHRRKADLLRIYQAGGRRVQDDDVPEPLAERLCEEVQRIADRMFNMCWRAIDYCPPSRLEPGDLLRACITADHEFTPEDTWGLRDAMIQAFRLRGIRPAHASFFSEDTLRWPVIDPARWKNPSIDPRRLFDDGAERELRRFLDENAGTLGVKASDLTVYPLETARLTSPADLPQTVWSTQIMSDDAGFTLVFDSAGRLRYAIPSTPLPLSAPATSAGEGPQRGKKKRDS